jgi:hypothetical protein
MTQRDYNATVEFLIKGAESTERAMQTLRVALELIRNTEIQFRIIGMPVAIMFRRVEKHKDHA